LDENINMVKKNPEALLDASEEVGLEVNMEDTTDMFMFCHQTARKNHYVKVANKSIENVAVFKYLGMTLTY
jgi:hypothetical protein